MIEVEAHPSLYVRAFESRFPAPLGECPTPSWLRAMLGAEFHAPVTRGEETRRLVRDVFRHGGYKPTGRGKPAAEYLVKAATERRLTSINAAVDAGNIVSLHSGLPVSLVDADRATPPLRIAVVQDDQRFVFNAAGQEIRLAGLVCLWDHHGPCANGIKDSQRTKTTPHTTRTISVVWGARALTGQTDRAVTWYRELVAQLGAETASMKLQTAAAR